MEVLRIDSDGGKTCENAPSGAADRRSQDTFEPEFKSLHELNHRNKRLFVKGRDGIVQDVKSPLFVVAFRSFLSCIHAAAGFRSLTLLRPFHAPTDVLGDPRR